VLRGAISPSEIAFNELSMPRGNRHRLPGYVWHVTERCHRRQFLLKFARDRRNWVRWLYQSRKRFGLSVLNYQVTSNHVHLLVRDGGAGEIERSMQLIAGCTGQAYNRRKHRRGAFWEDCYHATAVDTDEYLARCLVYIDLNMVRAGAVDHPREWQESGYQEIQSRTARYRIIDREALCDLLGVADEDLARVRNDWIESRLGRGNVEREKRWSEAVAVGGRTFVERVQDELAARARYRCVEDIDGLSVLRDGGERYWPQVGVEIGALSSKMTIDFTES
jgi:REP-associated tyrosine transposase